MKKTGKIVVASYPQWYGVRTANYNPFDLVVIDEYAGMPHDEQVYNHLGEPLLFPTYDPYELPVYGYDDVYSILDHYENNPAFCKRLAPTIYSPTEYIGFHGTGMDCSGTPTFTHFTVDQIINAGYKDMNAFELLTVGTVLNWLGWFLQRLENAKLKVRQ